MNSKLNSELKDKLKKYNLTSISQNPEHYAANVSIPKLANLIKIANIYYYNTGKAILTDQVYDIIRDILHERSPNNKVLKQIGAPIQDKEKVKLPYWMGSMDKIKSNTGKIIKWTQKYDGPYFISEKLDGISALLVYDVNSQPKLYTRGNGEYGQNITQLLRYIKVPNIRINKSMAIRGELIIPKKVFETKYAKDFSNARSMVSGIANSKRINVSICKDVELVVYEIIHPYGYLPSQQFELLSKYKFRVAQHQMLTEVNDEILTTTLLEFKNNSNYEIDGIIVADNNPHPRNVSGNPKYGFAFKMILTEQTANVKIIDVEWNASKHGYLKPRIQFEPVNIGGAVLSYTTGFNAKYIVDNSIGKGAVIKIIRSGDVIPYILEIIKPASRPSLPKVKYHWNPTNIDIILDNMDDNQDVIIRRLVSFFKTLSVDYLSTGLITRLVVNGYNTISKIITMNVNDFLELDGIKNRMANKLYNSIHTVIDNPIHPTVLMSASNVFSVGFGVRKLNMIFKVYPNILEKPIKQINVELINKVEGFSNKTSGQFVSKLPEFHRFLKQHPQLKIQRLEKSNKRKSRVLGKLNGYTIVITGFRDKSLHNFIESEGGAVGSGISGKVTLVIAKDPNSNSGKIKKAKDKGIKIITLTQFMSQFGD